MSQANQPRYALATTSPGVTIFGGNPIITVHRLGEFFCQVTGGSKEEVLSKAQHIVDALNHSEGNEPVAWRWKEKDHWFNWTSDFEHHDRARSLGCPIEYAYARSGA